MTKEIKAVTFVSMISMLFISFGVTLVESKGFESTHAIECQHVGVHYDVKEATKNATGIKEYWVCCNCHEHFLAKPTNTNYVWSEGGKANITIDNTDDRYIPKLSNGTPDSQGYTYSSDGKTVTDFTPPADYNGVVVIPEGVDTIQKGAFANVDIDYVVVGEGVTIQANAFKDSGISAYGQGDDITIYLDMTRDEAKSLPSGWDTAYTQSLWGWGLIGKEDVKAKVYYKGEWHYDESGKPVPNK